MQLGCRFRLVTGVVAVALTAAGCGSSPTTGVTSTTSAGSSTGATVGTPGSTGAGCGVGHTPGSTTLHPSIGGRVRTVIVHVPTGYAGTAAVALVLNLHGSGSTAQQQEDLTGMDATSDVDDFIVAYPEADITAGTGFDWNVPGVPLIGGAQPPAGAADDVSFLTALVSDLGRTYCVDRRRVYATGLSGGGRMSSQLACDAPGTFAAVAPVAGVRFPDPCPAAGPVPIIAFHGTADPVDPYLGNGQAYWTYSVPVAVSRWAAHNGCAATPGTTTGTGYTLTAYSGCGSASAAELYSLIGEGHEWPGGTTLPRAVTAVLGPQSDAVDANSVMWSFFSSHPLRTGA